MSTAFTKKESPAAGNGGACQDRILRDVSRVARRRQAAPRPRLSADRENLRRSIALGRHLLELLLEDAPGRKELLRTGFALNEALAAWHRRVEPHRYGREAGAAP